MPQIATAFAPDFVTTMRWALDAGVSPRAGNVTYACDQSEDGSAHRQIGAGRHQRRAPTRGGGGG